MMWPDDPERPLDQGEPDTRSAALRGAFDPMLHPDRYLHGPAIAFEFGELDRHIPAENAERFAREVSDLGGAADIRITRHAGLDHLTSARAPAVVQRCLDWITG
jgi:hypothetical protein